MKAIIKNTIVKLGGEAYYRYLYGKLSFLVNPKLYRQDKQDLANRKKFYSKFINSGDLVFDIGANDGNRIEPLLKIGAKVIAVEPQQNCCKFLKHKYGNSITIVRKGVSDKVGEMKLFISKHSVFSTFSDKWVKDVAPNRAINPYSEEEIVPMTTLDELQGQYGTPSFVKIDVEGFELNVIKGLSNSLKMMSFEYTVPELIDDHVACLQHLYDLDNRIAINFSVGESMDWGSEKWMSFHQFIDYMKSEVFINTGFGDIYVKNGFIH